jgi:hypothetical protein
VFGNAINYASVRINTRKYWPFQPKGTCMAPNGQLYFHPRSDLCSDDFASGDIVSQGLFIHEMTHVWQHQQGIFLPLRRHIFCRYSYSLKPGWPLRRYGIEQQAEIVRHAFVLKQGYMLAGAPGVDAYTSILPFAAD